MSDLQAFLEVIQLYHTAISISQTIATKIFLLTIVLFLKLRLSWLMGLGQLLNCLADSFLLKVS